MGKTTLKRALLRLRGGMPFRLVDQRAIPLAAMKPSFLALPLHRLAHARLRIPRIAALAAAEALGQRFRNSALRPSWDSEWSAYLTQASQCLIDTAQGNALASRLALLVDSTAQAHFARHTDCPQSFAIFDEGVLQRGISIAQAFQGAHPDRLTRYFSTCPVPDCAIVVTADIATIQSRLNGRPGDSAGHSRDTTLAVQATEICSEALQTRGIPTLRLDLSGAGSADPKPVIEFLQSVWMI